MCARNETMREVTRDRGEERNLVGVFADDAAAKRAAAALDGVGFPPDRVGLVSDNVRQAREVVGSQSLTGVIIGAVVGALLTAGIVVFGGEPMRVNGVAIALGAVIFIGAGAAIGALVGRAKLFGGAEFRIYEGAVSRGDTLVTVRCAPDQIGRAREILQRSGASTIREEDTPEGP